MIGYYVQKTLQRISLYLKNIKIYTKKTGPYVEKSKAYIILNAIPLSILFFAMGVLFWSYYITHLSKLPMTAETAEATSNFTRLTAAQAEQFTREYLKQVVNATDNYGRVDESSINYYMQQLIKNHFLWQNFYRLYREDVWGRFESNRIRDGVSFEEYDPMVSDLFTDVKVDVAALLTH